MYKISTSSCNCLDLRTKTNTLRQQPLHTDQRLHRASVQRHQLQYDLRDPLFLRLTKPQLHPVSVESDHHLDFVSSTQQGFDMVQFVQVGKKDYFELKVLFLVVQAHQFHCLLLPHRLYLSFELIPSPIVSCHLHTK